MKIIKAKTKNDKIRLVINKTNIKIIIEDNVAELLGNFTSDKDIEYLEKELKNSLEMSSEYETAMWVIETLNMTCTNRHTMLEKIKFIRTLIK